MRLKVYATIVMVLVAMFACSGDDDSPSAGSFCDDYRAVEDELAGLPQSTPDELDRVMDEIAAVDPPEEIADAYDDVVTAYREIVEEGSLTDPAMAARFADAEEAIVDVEAYVTENCSADG
jgi:hypothetical protein